MFTSLAEIQTYIEECEQKRLDLDNEEVWSNAYLPTNRTPKARGKYEGKVIFKHVQHVRGEKNQEQKRNCEPALNLAHEYYGDNELKKKDVSPTKRVDFGGIARHYIVNGSDGSVKVVS